MCKTSSFPPRFQCEKLVSACYIACPDCYAFVRTCLL